MSQVDSQNFRLTFTLKSSGKAGTLKLKVWVKDDDGRSQASANLTLRTGARAPELSTTAGRPHEARAPRTPPDPTVLHRTGTIVRVVVLDRRGTIPRKSARRVETWRSTPKGRRRGDGEDRGGSPFADRMPPSPVPARAVRRRPAAIVLLAGLVPPAAAAVPDRALAGGGPIPGPDGTTRRSPAWPRRRPCRSLDPARSTRPHRPPSTHRCGTPALDPVRGGEAHANDRIDFTPGGRVTVAFTPRAGDRWTVGGTTPTALPGGRLDGATLRAPTRPRRRIPDPRAPAAPAAVDVPNERGRGIGAIASSAMRPGPAATGRQRGHRHDPGRRHAGPGSAARSSASCRTGSSTRARSASTTAKHLDDRLLRRRRGRRRQPPEEERRRLDHGRLERLDQLEADEHHLGRPPQPHPGRPDGPELRLEHVRPGPPEGPARHADGPLEPRQPDRGGRPRPRRRRREPRLRAARARATRASSPRSSATIRAAARTGSTAATR